MIVAFPSLSFTTSALGPGTSFHKSVCSLTLTSFWSVCPSSNGFAAFRLTSE